MRHLQVCHKIQLLPETEYVILIKLELMKLADKQNQMQSKLCEHHT